MKPELKYIDDEERELIEDIEANADDLKAMAPEQKLALLARFRGAEVRKNVTMRLSESVIAGLKAKAEADGIPYQTLASMVLQKYVRGTLLEKDAILEAVKILKS